MKHGAIFEVPAELVVRALKVIGALPQGAECIVANEDTPLLVKVLDPDGEHLPLVPEGTVYTRRLARAGYPLGVPKAER